MKTRCSVREETIRGSIIIISGIGIRNQERTVSRMNMSSIQKISGDRSRCSNSIVE